jgi:hypothetical protein
MLDKVRELLHIIYELVLKPLFRALVRYLKARGWDIFTKFLAWVISRVIKPLLKVLSVYFLKALGIVCLVVMAPLILLMLAVRCGPPPRKKSPEESLQEVEESYDTLVDSIDRFYWEGEAGDAEMYDTKGHDTEQE